MKKCPVCAVEVEDTAPFCNICGVNLAGAKDVGPSNVETPVTKEESTKTVSPVSSPPPISTGRAKSSFYLPALQFLLAVALLGLVLYYTTADVPNPESTVGEGVTFEDLRNYTTYNEPLTCPGWGETSSKGNPNGCPLVLNSEWDTSNFNVKTHEYQTILGLTVLMGLCILVQARRISDSNIMAPLFLMLVILGIVYLFMGRNQEPLEGFESTLGATAGLVIIVVSYIVFLYAVTGKDISEAPLSTIYSFIGAGSLVFAALHHNWVRGPWLSCDTSLKSFDSSLEQACTEVGGQVQYAYIDLQPIEMLILLAGILFLLLGIAGYILQTVRLKDMEEAKYIFMILMGLSLQFIVVVWNLVRNSANF